MCVKQIRYTSQQCVFILCGVQAVSWRNGSQRSKLEWVTCVIGNDEDWYRELNWSDRTDREGEKEMYSDKCLYYLPRWHTEHSTWLSLLTEPNAFSSTNCGTVHSILVQSLPRGTFYCNKMLLFQSSVYVKVTNLAFYDGNTLIYSLLVTCRLLTIVNYA